MSKEHGIVPVSLVPVDIKVKETELERLMFSTLKEVLRIQ